MPKVPHGASIRVLHCCQSSAHRLAISKLRPHTFTPLTIVLHQVTLGLPLLCLPWGVHLNATLGSESVSIRRTWPSHLHLLFVTTTESSSRLQDVSRSFLLIWFGQRIYLMHRTHLVWKTSSFLEISLVTFQHSPPYNRTDSTSLLKILILVRTFSLVDFRNELRVPKAWFALDILTDSDTHKVAQCSTTYIFRFEDNQGLKHMSSDDATHQATSCVPDWYFFEMMLKSYCAQR